MTAVHHDAASETFTTVFVSLVDAAAAPDGGLTMPTGIIVSNSVPSSSCSDFLFFVTRRLIFLHQLKRLAKTDESVIITTFSNTIMDTKIKVL